MLKSMACTTFYLSHPKLQIQEFWRWTINSTGFIYAVSSASTTGSKSGISDASEFLQKLQNLNLKHPILTGFNINNRASYMQACAHTRGAIIGSSFIKAISKEGVLEENIKTYIKSILEDDHTIKR